MGRKNIVLIYIYADTSIRKKLIRLANWIYRKWVIHLYYIRSITCVCIHSLWWLLTIFNGGFHSHMLMATHTHTHCLVSHTLQTVLCKCNIISLREFLFISPFHWLFKALGNTTIRWWYTRKKFHATLMISIDLQWHTKWFFGRNLYVLSNCGSFVNFNTYVLNCAPLPYM